jgi:hypothetical protein
MYELDSFIITYKRGDTSQENINKREQLELRKIEQ